MKIKYFLTLTSISTLAICANAFAGDGSIGNPSTGSSALAITVSEEAQITDVNNITVTYTGADLGAGIGIDQDDAVCIYSNDNGNAIPRYKVTATGSGGTGIGAGSIFNVTDGAGTPHLIAYTVKWNTAASAGTIAMTSGTQIGPFSGTNTFPCVTNNADFRVLFTQSALLNKPAGLYSGTLSLAVIPDDT